MSKAPVRECQPHVAVIRTGRRLYDHVALCFSVSDLAIMRQSTALS